MPGPYYENSKVDSVDYIEAADLEAIETAFDDVDTDKANKVSGGTENAILIQSASGDLVDSGTALPAGGIAENPQHVALGAGVDMDLSAGRSFDKTVTATTTFTFSNIPASGELVVWQLELVNGGSQTVNWPASVVWPNSGVAPSWTVSGTDQVVFSTRDGGTTVYGSVRGQVFS